MEHAIPSHSPVMTPSLDEWSSCSGSQEEAARRQKKVMNGSSRSLPSSITAGGNVAYSSMATTAAALPPRTVAQAPDQRHVDGSDQACNSTKCQEDVVVGEEVMVQPDERRQTDQDPRRMDKNEVAIRGDTTGNQCCGGEISSPRHS